MNSKGLFGLIFLGVFLFGCAGDVRDTLGMRRDAPDEFKVVSNAPLSVPPDFSLRPPLPGAKRPQQVDIDSQARSVLIDKNLEKEKPEVFSGASSGESTFLKRANVETADPDIKSILLEQERQQVFKEENDGVFDKVISYTKGEKEDEEPVVDAVKERERITEKQSSDAPINEGEIPVVEPKERGLLGRLFN